MHQLNRRFVIPFALLAGAGCGAAQMNDSPLRSANYSVHAAESEGASQHPRPARLLALARLEIMRAVRASDNGDERSATLLLEGAQADAELARQLARTLEEQQKARVAWTEVNRESPFDLDRETDQDQEHTDQGGTL